MIMKNNFKTQKNFKCENIIKAGVGVFRKYWSYILLNQVLIYQNKDRVN